jgi:hypothetical protein
MPLDDAERARRVTNVADVDRVPGGVEQDRLAAAVRWGRARRTQGKAQRPGNGIDERSPTELVAGCSQIQYNWYQANSDYVINVSPTGNRTTVPRFFWSVADGVKAYPLPVDVTRERMVVNGVNYTQWLDGRLNTMAGGRLNHTRSERLLHTGVRWISNAKTANFNLGADYTINRWWHPFVALSDSSQPPYLGSVSDPYGNARVVSHGIGGEAGFKIHLADDRLSGSVSCFYSTAKNDLYGVNSTISAENRWVLAQEIRANLAQVAAPSPPISKYRISGCVPL